MARKIVKQTASFGVLRANPRISGNVKITVDSNKDIWLNSIDSNAEMSNEAYKGFRISPDSSFDRDLYEFFKEGSTPPQFVFGLFGEGESVPNQTTDLNTVYDFKYATGVTPLISNKYGEEFSYLAPMWLGADIPDYFVIFRVNDPIDYSYRVPVTTLTVGQTYKVTDGLDVDPLSPSYVPFTIQSDGETYSAGDIFEATDPTFQILSGSGEVIFLDPTYRLSDIENVSSHFQEKILPKASLVSTYDLRENSKIGKYLRNIRNSAGFSEDLITARFEENQLTTFNGVNYSAGVFDKSGDYLYDYYTTPETQIGFEEFITDGFRRNGIISTKLLNLEFLFDDLEAPEYTINRYFGLYVNAAEIAKFKLNGDALYRDQGASGNTPVPKRNEKGYYYQNLSYYQYNNDGVRLFLDPDYISGEIPSSEDVNISESTKLFWTLDKMGNFHSLKRDTEYGVGSPTNPSYIYGLTGTENELVLQDTRVDLSVFTGEDTSTRKQYGGVSTGEKGRAYSVIRIGGELSINNDDCFVFYNPLGLYGVPGEKYDLIRSSDLSSSIDEWGPGSYYAQDGAYYFHPFGTNEEIAQAISGIFNSFTYNSFEAFASGDEVLIRTRAQGIKENNKYGLDFYQDFQTLSRMPDSRRGLIFINEKDACDINFKQNFIGGSNYSNTRVKIKIEDANKIKVGETFLETNLGSSKVIGKYRFIDQYARDSRGQIIGIKDFETHATLEIENVTHSISFGSARKISAFENYSVPLGIFSFYGLREIDGDFWASEYGYTPTEEYYKYLDTQPGGRTKIVPGKSYFVSAGAVIDYNGSTYTGPDFFEGVSGVDSYTLITASTTAESNVYPTLSGRGLYSFYLPNQPIAPGSFDSNFYPDLDSFPGFSGIQKLNFIDDETGLETKYAQLTFGKLDSEYDYTQDNYNKDYVTLSRVSPYISKWVYRGGTDVRGNGYRLDSNIAFTPLNFSPSFFNRNQNPQYFTHEWYQLQRPPFSLPEENIHEDKSYLGGEIEISELIETNPAGRDYFVDYFTIEGEDLTSYYPGSSTIENVNLSERYTVLDYNEASGFSETLFRGAKVRIKRNYKDYTATGSQVKPFPNDRFFEDYKFSCVIVPVQNIENEIQSPVSVRVIENRQFKTITFLVEVLIEEGRTLNFEDISPEKQYIDLDYFLLYSLKDKLDKESVSSTTIPSIEVPAVGDIKLSASLNITTTPNEAGIVSSVNAGGGKIYIIPGSEYETDLREEINLVYPASIDTTTTSYSTTGGSFYGIRDIGDPTNVYTLPVPVGVGQDFIEFTGINGANYQFDFTEISLPAPQTIPTSTFLNVISGIPIYQREGGIEYWRNIMEKISFANLSFWINTNHPYVTYESYTWDPVNKTTIRTLSDFRLEFVQPSAFEQQTLIYPVLDTDKPQEVSLLDIGYDLQEIQQKSELYRYSGGYVPKFRDVLRFENVKADAPFWVIPDQFEYGVTMVDKDIDDPYYDLGDTKELSFNGVPSKEISLVRGVSYTFDVSDPSNTGYQIYFSTSLRGNNYPDDAILDGYTVFGTPGTFGSTITLTAPYNWPATVYVVTEGGKYTGNRVKIVDGIEYAYCSFGPGRDDFGIAKNLNYYKYSDAWLFKIGQDSAYNPVYPLIDETPIDRRNLSIFESSWDPGFYREYQNSSDYISIPGTKNMKEQKSFFGSKVMQTPPRINSQKQIINPESISNVLEVNIGNYPEYDILWEETETEIRGIILGDRILERYFLNDGAKDVFRKFIVPEFGFGDLSGIDDDFNEYMGQNVVPVYKISNNGTYLKKIPVSPEIDLFPIENNLADYQKTINGYSISSDVSFTKINDIRYEFRISKDPSFDYSLAFSIEIEKI